MAAYSSLVLSAVALGFSIAVPLGPTSITAIRYGLSSGAKAAFWIGMGAALTDMFYIFAVYLGLTPLLLRLHWLVPVLYGFGVIILGRMGLQILAGAIRGRANWDAGAQAEAGPVLSGWRAPLGIGISVTVSNPATITFWLSIGGAFVGANLLDLPLWQAIGVVAGVLAGSAAWFTILAGLIATARSSLNRFPWLFRGVEFVSGSVLLGFALLFLIKGIQALL